MTQFQFPQNRTVYFDNIRALMIVFVVLMHVAVTYSGFGDWYYNEPGDLDMLSSISFALFQTGLQAFFMSILFMIAGYFSARAVEQKTLKQFITGRLFRLGVPTVIYILVIHPIAVKMIYTDLNMLDFYWNGLKSGKMISWTGPMWFAQTLLIFSLFYAAKRKLMPNLRLPAFSFSFKSALMLIGIITLLAFSIRLVYPVGSSVLNLQFSYFAAYMVFYVVGILAYNFKSFESLGAPNGKKYIRWALLLGLPLWFVIMFFGGATEGVFLINGGWNWQAFAYAVWESFICVTFCVGLVGIFREKRNRQNKLQKFMADQAFGVYVFHAPILIGVSLLLKNVALYPLLKFGFVGIIVIPSCFVFSWLIKKMPGLNKVFV
jgi:surface polysaccharide O-acyltransferase-like enzyme